MSANVLQFPSQDEASNPHERAARQERVKRVSAVLSGNGYTSSDALGFGEREWHLLSGVCPSGRPLSVTTQALIYHRMVEIERRAKAINQLEAELAEAKC